MLNLEQALEKIEIQDERIKQLEEVLFGPGKFITFYQHCFRLTKTQAVILGVMVSRVVATKRAVELALYSDRGSDWPDVKIFTVQVCRMRKILKPFGIEIITDHGIGWYLRELDKEKIKTAVLEKFPNAYKE